MHTMTEQKAYKVLIPYSESATPRKSFKVEYEVEAPDNACALRKAENLFNSYSESNSASWVRIINRGGVRVWRLSEGLPKNPQEIDELCERLVKADDEKSIAAMLKTLAQLEDAFTTSFILARTKHANMKIAAEAIEAIEKIGDPTSLLAVKNLYKDGTPIELKIRIITAISRIALPEDDILDFMSEALGDESPEVRRAAEEAFNILEGRALASGWVDWLKARQKRMFNNKTSV